MRIQIASRKPFLLLLVVVVAGCSKVKNDVHSANNSSSSSVQSSFGTIIGTAQIALGSGDVKPLAFRPVRLVQENHNVLTDAEKQDIKYDANQGSEAQRLGVISMDEYGKKVQAKVDA